MIINRRFFLKSSGLAVVATGVLPGFLRCAAAVTTSKPKKVLVVVFQRGAMDGLNAVVPYSDDRYYQFRPALAIPRPGKGDDGHRTGSPAPPRGARCAGSFPTRSRAAVGDTSWLWRAR